MKTTIVFFILWCYAYAANEATPGLQVRPVPQNGVIYYNVSDEKTRQKHQEELEIFLKPYYSFSYSPNVIICENSEQRNLNYVCDFVVKELGNCGKEYGYGYAERARGFCIFLKLDDVLNWKPKIYQNKNLPDSMPTEVKTAIADNDWTGKNHYVYVSCAGASDLDRINAGPLLYYPIKGFPQSFFPYTSLKDYRSPLVALHIERPQQGVDINIRCKAWAENIALDQAITNFKIRMI